MTKSITLSLALIVATTSNAFAHHPLGGEVPETMLHGLLSGLGHPLIGFDHLAFVLAIGVLAAFQARRWMMPLGFILGTVAGSLLTLAAVTLPLTEVMITLSVLVAGVIVMRGREVTVMPAAALAAFAGLFHGTAYGAAIIGAEPTPVMSYLAGFGMIQFGLMMVAGFAVRTIWKAASMMDLQPRLAGAVIAGVGLTYIVKLGEQFLFPAM
jgi:urease accessory protein